ncbi:MAG: uracil-DNA glycosylase family protein [Pontixanthobacter sp.]
MKALQRAVRNCTVCREHLPLEPRPIVQFSQQSRIAVIGQAPGRAAHDSGVAFDDASGDRLAQWMGIDMATLHDPRRVAIVSMGLCYPGKGKGGDLPPRRECAPLWQDRILGGLHNVRLTLLVGASAQKYHCPETRTETMRARVARAVDFLPAFPLPHPSWRSTLFMRDNPWFERETLPRLRERVTAALA